MIVVSDASPLVALSRVARLEILRQLYGRVVVPDAVHAELLAGEPEGGALRNLTWLERRTVSDPTIVRELAPVLDAGEVEAIALALELKADVLLMDERRGRRAAHDRGLRVVGLLGALVDAKGQEFLPSVAAILDELVERAGFRVADDVRRRILEAAGESSAGTTG